MITNSYIFTMACIVRWEQILVILWCTRTLGDYPGWSDLLGGYPNEGTVAVRCFFDSPHETHMHTSLPSHSSLATCIYLQLFYVVLRSILYQCMASHPFQLNWYSNCLLTKHHVRSPGGTTYVPLRYSSKPAD